MLQNSFPAFTIKLTQTTVEKVRLHFLFGLLQRAYGDNFLLSSDEISRRFCCFNMSLLSTSATMSYILFASKDVNW